MNRLLGLKIVANSFNCVVFLKKSEKNLILGIILKK